jgi:hypothetical protein
MTMNAVGPSRTISSTRPSPACDNAAIARASRMRSPRASLGVPPADAGPCVSSLIATARPSTVSNPWYTCPIPPWPASRINWYRPPTGLTPEVPTAGEGTVGAPAAGGVTVVRSCGELAASSPGRFMRTAYHDRHRWWLPPGRGLG